MSIDGISVRELLLNPRFRRNHSGDAIVNDELSVVFA
jgi:hypothetical protein